MQQSAYSAFALPRGRDDMLERSTVRAKATRSGNSLRLEVQWTSNLSEFRKRALIVRALSHIWSVGASSLASLATL